MMVANKAAHLKKVKRIGKKQAPVTKNVSRIKLILTIIEDEIENIRAEERENDLKTICTIILIFNIISTFCVEYARATLVKSFNLHLLDGHRFKPNDPCFTSTFAFQFGRTPAT